MFLHTGGCTPSRGELSTVHGAGEVTSVGATQTCDMDMLIKELGGNFAACVFVVQGEREGGKGWVEQGTL